MARKKVWLGSAGPYLFDDAIDYGDGITQRGIRSENGFYSDTQATINEELVRLDQLITYTSGIHTPLAVTDIDNPAAELGGIDASAGGLVTAYEVEANSDQHTIYAWEAANAGGANSPYVLAGSSGFWVAVSGKYREGDQYINGDFEASGDVAGDTASISNAITGGSLSTTGHIRTTSGSFYGGTNDTQRGYLHLYGPGSGTYGGSIYLYLSGDHDTLIDEYMILASQDDLQFRDDSNGTIFQITGGATPYVEFNFDIVDNNLTASRLVGSNASKALESVDISDWLSGTANQITVTDDGDGTATLSTPQDIHTGASPTFANVYVPTGGFTGISGGSGWGNGWTYVSGPPVRIRSQAASYQLRSESNFAPELSVQNYTAIANGPSIAFQKSRGTIASPSVVSSGDYMGLFYFYGYDTGFQPAAYFGGRVDGAPSGAGNVPGRIFFATNSTGGSITEWVVLKQDGAMGFGNETSPQEDIHANDTVRADVAFNLNGTDGWTGTFNNADGDTVTVSGGIITNVA